MDRYVYCTYLYMYNIHTYVLNTHPLVIASIGPARRVAWSAGIVN